jgi:RND family efflux transporter MFP subunit
MFWKPSCKLLVPFREGFIMKVNAQRRHRGEGSTALATVLALVATTILLNGCGKEQPEVKEIVRPVKMMIIGGSNASGTREYPGRVRSAQEIELSFEVPGRIIEIHAQEGQAVAGGALVAALDPRDYEAARDRDRARRNESRADYQRNQTLYERDAISLRDLEVVRRRFEVSEANLKQLDKALSDTRLYAPYAGTIAGRLAENHENVAAKQAIVIFHDDSVLEIKASFPETEYLRIRDLGGVEDMTRSLSPTVEVSAAAGQMIEAWVKELRNTADPVTRTYEVTLGFTAPAGLAITSGMTATVIITLQGAADSTLIPVAAVVAGEGNQSTVWVYDEGSGTVSSRAVTVGQMTGDEVEILDGLKDGEKITVLGSSNLGEGMKVRPLGE